MGMHFDRDAELHYEYAIHDEMASFNLPILKRGIRAGRKDLILVLAEKI